VNQGVVLEEELQERLRVKGLKKGYLEVVGPAVAHAVPRDVEDLDGVVGHQGGEDVEQRDGLEVVPVEVQLLQGGVFEQDVLERVRNLI